MTELPTREVDASIKLVTDNAPCSSGTMKRDRDSLYNKHVVASISVTDLGQDTDVDRKNWCALVET
jgi:hypothetical protein